MKYQIYITTQFVGFHFYDEAPIEVLFLTHKHRHLFKVKVIFDVEHKNRELEFFIEKDFIETEISEFLRHNRQQVGSCEMIAEHILQTHKRIAQVEVSEDGENGAIVTR